MKRIPIVIVVVILLGSCFVMYRWDQEFSKASRLARLEQFKIMLAVARGERGQRELETLSIQMEDPKSAVEICGPLIRYYFSRELGMVLEKHYPVMGLPPITAEEIETSLEDVRGLLDKSTLSAMRGLLKVLKNPQDLRCQDGISFQDPFQTYRLFERIALAQHKSPEDIGVTADELREELRKAAVKQVRSFKDSGKIAGVYAPHNRILNLVKDYHFTPSEIGLDLSLDQFSRIRFRLS